MKKSKEYSVLLALLILLSGCGVEEYRPQSGDLLFQINEQNDFVDAIVETTSGKQDMPYSHVAILDKEGGEYFVIEAVTKGGVHKIKLQEFLDSSAHTKSGKPVVDVYRIREHVNAKTIISNAEKYIGKPYDFNFLPTDSAIYCSELVHKSYLDNEGNPIFKSSAPMTFKDTTGQTMSLWINYFGKRNMAISEGVMGTNPVGISKENSIEQVYRYWE